MTTYLQSGSSTINGNVTSVMTPGDIPATYTRIVKTFCKVFGAGGASNIYTPTGGKNLYVTQIVIGNTAAGYVKIGDNVSAAMGDGAIYDAAVTGYTIANSSVVINFNVPMKVSTVLNMYVGQAGTVIVSFIGWEAT